jgi:hypothetical protein
VSLKNGINSHHFASIEEMQQKVTGVADIPKEVFHRYFQQWQVSWSMYVVKKGGTLRVFRLGFIYILFTASYA